LLIEKEELLSVVPHRGRMLLLSGVKGYNLKERSIEAEYHITSDCLFYDPAMVGVPAWAGFEFIAQAISAYSGIRDRENGIPPKMGYILSIASMQMCVSIFGNGSTVEIRAAEIERVDMVGTFKGEILLHGTQVLEGRLMVMEINHEQAQAMKKEQNAYK
jgi:predicted hotdog family 3-hydroxylacyl-ACP dehydratase